MMIYPAICSEHFKIILEISPKTNSKLIHACLDFFILTMEKIFSGYVSKENKLNASIESLNRLFNPKSSQPGIAKPEAIDVLLYIFLTSSFIK
jgi:hypothetical protein